MKRFAIMVCTALSLALGASPIYASWSSACYSGYQPWYNIFAKRYKCLTPEEERLQKFWHDYYDALKNFYCALDHVDWVAYYKNHGYQINGGCGGRINYAPVFVSPSMQWAVPSCASCGPPTGPGPGCGPGYGPGGPGMAMGPPPGYPAGTAFAVPNGMAPPPGAVPYPGTAPQGMMPPNALAGPGR